MRGFFKKIKLEWQAAWQDSSFKWPFLAGWAVVFLLLPMLPKFYQFIENREGVVLNDYLLRFLTPRNVSIPVFICVWMGALMITIRSLTTPRILLNYMYAYVVFILLRNVCLVLVPLNAPIGIIELKDPLTDLFYGGTFITKDLFFSGHTATMVIMFLSLHKKYDKLFCKIAAFVVAGLLLVQHVHYSIDILAAPFFAFLSFYLGQKWLQKMEGVVLQKASPN